MHFAQPLPIDDVLSSLSHALTHHTAVVLEAPPGAGKTTRVPLALLDAPWMHGQRILMLEPRRLAARAAAQYMASTLGERVGDTVGYRIRGETRVSGATRIDVVTEGVLARLLAADQSLDGYGAVLFDEFHERSLHADLGLALVLETQQHLRDDLRILVMSATLDGVGVAQLIGAPSAPAPVIRSAGRAFPVVTLYRPPRTGDRLEATVSRVIREVVSTHEGDVLVFLPGAGEQRRVAARLAGDNVLRDARARVHQLHGSMSLTEQNAAIAAAPVGTRKIVLATSVAETSITVTGVRVVVDSGVSRLPRYDARAGLTRLETVRVSRASADQRRGRAGRVAAGTCYRLWDEHEEHMLAPRTRPEMLDADLASLALALADAGISDPTALRWLDAPRAGPFAQARELLLQLGALDANGRITAHGQRMAALPLQPRLAHLLLEAQVRHLSRLGSEIAALLEERDILSTHGGMASYGPTASDLRLRVEALRRLNTAPTNHDTFDITLGAATVDGQAAWRVRQLARELNDRLEHRPGSSRISPPADDTAHVGALLALAYPDRIAQRRPGREPRFLLRNGIGAALPAQDALQDAEWLAVAELEGAPPEYRIARAAPITLDEILEDVGGQVICEQVVEWHEPTRAVRARRRRMLGALVLDDVHVQDVDAELVRTALLDAVLRAGVSALPWSTAGVRVRERLAFVRMHVGDAWPDVGDATLTDTLHDWLGPHVTGMRKWSDLERIDWSEALLAQLSWDKRAALDRLAPTHLEVPSGSRIAINYSEAAAPVLAVKLQEVFGWITTPMLLDGRVPVTLHLLSPAQRPVQVTRDLAGFWRSSYFDVRKELRGRYPRHPWPDDPLTATPTRRAKPRGT